MISFGLRPQDDKERTNRHSERSEESPTLLFKLKNQKRDPSALQPQDDTER